MPHALWKGSISFGLLTIPVSLYPATSRNELAFHLLDRRDFAPIRQERHNDRTGELVPWEEVVRGYEYAEGEFVVLTDADFRAANVEATQTIDIMHFVDATEIDPLYYDTPYYLEPMKPGRKAYALLRETMRRTGLVGIARTVIRSRQHVAAVRPVGDLLVADLLHWQYEIRDASELDVRGADLAELQVSEQELAMAEQLVSATVAKWDPAAYKDTYRDDLLALIDKKVTTGETHVLTELPAEAEAPAGGAQVVDIMALLKRSVDKAKTEGGNEKAPARVRRRA